MGDRTYTVIIVNLAHAELVDDLITEHDHISEFEKDGACKRYIDYDANYGNIDWLEALLEEHFIPYDKNWEAGDEYGPGSKYVRVTQNDTTNSFELHRKEAFDAEVWIDANEVVRLLDDDLKTLSRLAEKAVEAVKPLSPTLDKIDLTPYHKAWRHKLRLGRAEEYGRAACVEGKISAPAQCTGYRSLLDGYEVGGGGDELAESWLRGFDDTLLAALTDTPSQTEGV